MTVTAMNNLITALVPIGYYMDVRKSLDMYGDRFVQLQNEIWDQERSVKTQANSIEQMYRIAREAEQDVCGERIAHVFTVLDAVGYIADADADYRALTDVGEEVIEQLGRLEWERIGTAFLVVGLCAEIERQIDLWMVADSSADHWRAMHDSHCDAGERCAAHRTPDGAE